MTTQNQTTTTPSLQNQSPADPLTTSLPTPPEPSLTADEKNLLERQAQLNAQYATIQALKAKDWSPIQHLRYTQQRAREKFHTHLTLDDYNTHVIKALCHYFTNNPEFEHLLTVNSEGTTINHNYRLRKGLCIIGEVGTGKTFLMQLFGINHRQNYITVPALTIATEYTEKEGGYTLLNRYKHLTIPWGNHAWMQYKNQSTLWQTRAGLCIDDAGTEENTYTHMGNKANVLAEILIARYENLAPHLTHFTTNLTKAELKEKYGPRVYSRLIANYNFIHLPGPDRRFNP